VKEVYYDGHLRLVMTVSVGGGGGGGQLLCKIEFVIERSSSSHDYNSIFQFFTQKVLVAILASSSSIMYWWRRHFHILRKALTNTSCSQNWETFSEVLCLM